MTRPVRVLHVIDTLGPGGAERLLWDLVRLSDPARVRHRVVTVRPDLGRYAYADRLRAVGAYGVASTSDASGAPPRRAPGLSAIVRALTGRLQAAPEPVRSAARAAASPLVHVGAAARLLRERHELGPDVVHGHVIQGFGCALALAMSTRTPLVHTVPALFAQLELEGVGWLVGAYRRHHGRVDRFVTGASLAELRAIGIADSKIVDITHAVIDVPAAKDALAARARHRVEVRARLGVPRDAPLLLAVGRLHPSKGQRSAIEALALLPAARAPAHLVALGDGADRDALLALATARGVADRVHLPGFVADPLPFYAAADVYLRTFLLEAENVSSYTSLAFGLPVVGFDTGAPTELLPHVGHGVLVPKGDAAGLARATAALLSDPDRAWAVGARGLPHAEAHLDVRVMVERITQSYEALAERRAGPP